MTAPAGFARERHLDVRDDIERGAEPLARIVAAVAELGPDETLVLHVPFEPVPLYRVLGAKGFAHNSFKIELARRAIIRTLEQAAAGTPQIQSVKAIL